MTPLLTDLVGWFSHYQRRTRLQTTTPDDTDDLAQQRHHHHLRLATAAEAEALTVIEAQLHRERRTA